MKGFKIGLNIGKILVIGTAFLLALTTICHAGTVLQLSETSTFQDAVLQGNKMQGQIITYSMAKGDFNGDGVEDFAIGAPRETGPRTTDEVGMVMVFMGGTGLNTDL
ncbi:MAG: hypothetical protein B6245_20205 [Desulfobacteraceae bacterium 4572_88]|nr:MAG: hypothetical protein B6245_20205 [Desulfobacteraceae bacterium 4572_88]RLC15164.1 MAG: hypothetical protein DRI57_13305 [Deltaproteobacteria bacterium]